MRLPLTSGETEVMQVLWEYGKLKPTEIQARFARPIKNAALRFQLKILLEKKHVSRRKVGTAYYYSAITLRQGAFKKMSRRMAKIFCSGSAAGLIAELIKTESLSSEEVRDLQQLAAARASSMKDKK